MGRGKRNISRSPKRGPKWKRPCRYTGGRDTASSNAASDDHCDTGSSLPVLS